MAQGLSLTSRTRSQSWGYLDAKKNKDECSGTEQRVLLNRPSPTLLDLWLRLRLILMKERGTT